MSLPVELQDDPVLFYHRVKEKFYSEKNSDKDPKTTQCKRSSLDVIEEQNKINGQISGEPSSPKPADAWGCCIEEYYMIVRLAGNHHQNLQMPEDAV